MNLDLHYQDEILPLLRTIVERLSLSSSLPPVVVEIGQGTKSIACSVLSGCLVKLSRVCSVPASRYAMIFSKAFSTHRSILTSTTMASSSSPAVGDNTSTAATADTPTAVEVVEVSPSSPNMKTIPFVVDLPASVMQGLNEPSVPDFFKAALGNAGVVGNILVLGNAANVWIGWGNVQQGMKDEPVQATGVPDMGPLVTAFPRTKYGGAFGNDGNPATTLIGGNPEDHRLSTQMATRLSQKVGAPVVVSCCLNDGEPKEWMAGRDRVAIAQRAAALAENRARSILREELP